jgi:hypothetical protein
MYEGQQDLMVGHQSLKDAHTDIHEYVADNLKELTKEKALIATGNKELAELIDQIRTRMGKLKPHCIQSSRVIVPAGTSKSTNRVDMSLELPKSLEF